MIAIMAGYGELADRLGPSQLRVDCVAKLGRPRLQSFASHKSDVQSTSI
jgi:hypothetical protein